ncbi:hypothetical protein HDU87_000570 [Geranomyces variabilis]|uniref:VanZ-like domain-containing protein n=1 Tax=Geranomyces variabilis TaxID=109894 RepID=A0AAD5XLQ5_9FUNG|nr:hypothetical protein HDU87_000570 [Geranomyces variabilis]
MRRPCAFALALHLVLLALLGFLPSSTTAAYLPTPLRKNDKLLHYVCFSILALLLYFTLSRETVQKTAIAAAAGVGVAAVGSELLQSIIGYWSGRIFDGADIMANFWGATTGLALAVLVDISWRACDRRRARSQFSRVPGDEDDNGDEIPLTSMV